MNEDRIVNEMIDMLFLKKWRKRLRYDFIDKKKEREDRYFRYHNGEYIDELLVVEKVDQMPEEYTVKRLLELGAEKRCFLLANGVSGVFTLEVGIEEAYICGLGAVIYCGNGVGYFQGEQCYGSPERWILVNKNKRGQEDLFD